jgi:hypothetical protein
MVLDCERTCYGRLPGWADHERRNQKWETTMEFFRASLLNVNPFPFEDFRAPITVGEGSGLDQWSGRYWLPASDRVEPTRKYCLIRGDGRLGEILVDRFLVCDIKEDFAAFQGDLHFA